MTDEYTPDLDDVRQYDEPEKLITVPVLITESTPLQVHTLPSREAVMRNVTVSSTPQQIVGLDYRRKSITLWATSSTASDFVYIGTDKNEVESGTSARLPAVVDTYADGAPIVVTMTHILPVWLRYTGENSVSVSFLTEGWAD